MQQSWKRWIVASSPRCSSNSSICSNVQIGRLMFSGSCIVSPSVADLAKSRCSISFISLFNLCNCI
ncbi:hypothetical protein DPMN_082083 [Dreissena polymorpha]|uniref:Uncharacterized protein n=1 Tax=Dreissena polymorpha TaxID=45954 RepID=A0A9D4BIF9_DREPO|nr:hypothetical protein DPMN_082083 [Dreissena polymorpha]